MYFVVPKMFASYHAVNRLWLSEVPFNLVGLSQKKNFGGDHCPGVLQLLNLGCMGAVLSLMKR